MTAPSSPEQANESITTVIDKGIHIDGFIKVDSGKALLIKGQFTGSLESNGVVVIGEGAVCIGSITARQVRVAGTIRKSDNDRPNIVVAKEALIVESSGVVDTDTLSYGAIELQFGARVAGALSPIGGVEETKQEQRLQSVPRQSTPAPASNQTATASSTVSPAARAPAVAPAPAAPAVVRTGPTPVAVSPMPGVPVSLLNVDGNQTDVSNERAPQRVAAGF